jgi:hypothetical protein
MLCGAPGFLEPIRGNAEVPTSVWESTDNWGPFKNQHAMHALVELGYCIEFAKVAPREGVSMRNTSFFLLWNGIRFLSFKHEQKQTEKKIYLGHFGGPWEARR